VPPSWLREVFRVFLLAMVLWNLTRAYTPSPRPTGLSRKLSSMLTRRRRALHNDVAWRVEAWRVEAWRVEGQRVKDATEEAARTPERLRSCSLCWLCTGSVVRVCVWGRATEC